MACRVPGCSTRYWNKSTNHTMFRAPSAKQLADLQKILSAKGVDNLGANDLVCILHFKEEYIERERVIYQSAGTQVLLLTYTAVPTIFPSKIPETVRKKTQKPGNLEYAVILDPESFVEQKNILKRKLSNDVAISSDEVETAKQIKTNALFQSVINAIHNHEKLSPHLNSLWITSICDEKCIR